MSSGLSILNAASESTGTKPGHFVSEDGRQTPFSALYTEGPSDTGAIDRIAQVLDLVSEQALKRTLNLRIFYRDYGQLMDTIHSWLSADVGIDSKSLVEDLYQNFNFLYVKHKIATDWNCRRYVYCG